MHNDYDDKDNDVVFSFLLFSNFLGIVKNSSEQERGNFPSLPDTSTFRDFEILKFRLL